MEKHYNLSGLGCAVCAANIEQKVSELPEVQTATVDFANAKIHLETTGDAGILSKIESIAHTYEPEIVVTEVAENTVKAEGEEERSDIKKEVGILVVAALFTAAGFVFGHHSLYGRICFLAAYAVAGVEVIYDAIRSLTKGNWFDENFLMAVATIGAIAIEEYPEAAAVMLFYRTGELLQNLAVDHSRKNISALMDIRPDSANLKTGDDVQVVSPTQVKVGDEIIVKPGEKVPLDGFILQGTSLLDTSALTGESVPREKTVGDEVLSGSINQSGLLTMQVTKTFGESTVSKILDMVENASARKAPTERFITRFSKIYTPVVIALAALIIVLPPLLSGSGDWRTWLHRGLVFLVISCPCALVISIPLGFFAGIGKSSQQGILVKGSNYLESLNNVSTIAFDKTGTLTQGTFTVTRILPAEGFSAETLLEAAAFAESNSTHPIARSILQAYGKAIDPSLKLEITEKSGHGILAIADGKRILAGNQKLFEAESIAVPALNETGTLIHVAIDDVYAGTLVIADAVKPDSQQAIRQLKAMDVRQTVMLTGDNAAVGNSVARELGLDRAYSDLLPDQKVEVIEELLSAKPKGSTLVFVGDGINDAPVLARADVGIAMGKLGSDAAIEAADVVIITDEPSRLPTAIAIAKKTHRIVWQNIYGALGAKGVVMVLGALGMVNMWVAVFADVGVMLLAVLNSLRILKKRI